MWYSPHSPPLCWTDMTCWPTPKNFNRISPQIIYHFYHCLDYHIFINRIFSHNCVSIFSFVHLTSQCAQKSLNFPGDHTSGNNRVSTWTCFMGCSLYWILVDFKWKKFTIFIFTASYVPTPRPVCPFSQGQFDAALRPTRVGMWACHLGVSMSFFF